MILFLLSGLLSSAWAIESTSNAIDLSLADISRANLDAFSSTRYSAAVLPLLARYQVAGTGNIQFDGLSIDDWSGNVAAVDSNTGPIAMGAFLQYGTGVANLEGVSLPGWKEPEESLERDFADIIIGGGLAVSFKNRKIGLGLNGAYYGRTYTVSNDSETGIEKLAFWKEDIEITKIQQVELNVSVAGKIANQVVVVGGVNDLIGITDARYPYIAARFSAVDQPFRGAYRSYGGVEVDLETMISSDGFALHYTGISGDILIASQVALRGGYRYDFHKKEQVPGIGIGLDDSQISLDYGFGVVIGEVMDYRHSIGIRFRI
jgi:hypothetical protein